MNVQAMIDIYEVGSEPTKMIDGPKLRVQSHRSDGHWVTLAVDDKLAAVTVNANDLIDALKRCSR